MRPRVTGLLERDLTTIEQKLTQTLGDLQFHNIVLSHKFEEAEGRIAESEPEIVADKPEFRE